MGLAVGLLLECVRCIRSELRRALGTLEAGRMPGLVKSSKLFGGIDSLAATSAFQAPTTELSRTPTAATTAAT